MTRLIDADALKELMIEVLEHIKENPKMDGQERHIIAGIHMLGEMIDDAPTVDAVPVEWIKRWSKEPMTEKDMKLAEQCEWNILEWLIADWQKRKEE